MLDGFYLKPPLRYLSETTHRCRTEDIESKNGTMTISSAHYVGKNGADGTSVERLLA